MPGIIGGALFWAISSYLKSGGGAAIQAHLDNFEAWLNNGAEGKEGYDNFVTYLEGFLQNPADRKTVVDKLYSDINAKKEEILKNPADPNKKLDLAVLLDCVRLVSFAIPDKKIAHQVRMVGEASLSFAHAFQTVKQLGGIAAAGVGGMLGPIGLALTGVNCIYSLFSQASDPNPIQEVADQIQKLAEQTSQLETMVNLRADKLESLIADFQWQALRQFKQLSTGMTDLKTLSQTHFQSTNLKLDRISQYITRGLPAVVLVGLDTLKFNAKTKLQLRNLTAQEHIDFLIGFAGWAQMHSKNPVFTGATNVSYAPEDVRDVLRADTSEKILYYLSHHPLCQQGGVSLANPYVWADAAEAYIQLRLSTPQFDSAYDDTHLPSFLGIYNTGVELMNFITNLQQNRALFQGLLNEYKNCLDQMSKAPSIDLLTARLDASYEQLITFSELAFQQSSKQDLIFSSFLKKRGNPHLRLVNSQDVQAALQDINRAPYEQQKAHLKRELFADLQRTATFFEGVLLQKVAHAHDSHTAITPMLQRLWDFGTQYFPDEATFAPGTCPATNDPHFTDTSQILPNDIFYAIFTGNITAVDNLIAANAHLKTDSLGRTPLHYACSTGQLEIVQKLVNAGADVNAKDQGGDTPVYLARKSRNGNIETFLMSRRADPYCDHWIPGQEEYEKAMRYWRNPIELNKAVQHFRTSAEQGHPASQFQYATFLEHGKGSIAKNPAASIEWYAKSADQGYLSALQHIAAIYLQGKIVPRNIPEAKKWLQKSVERYNDRNARELLKTL